MIMQNSVQPVNQDAPSREALPPASDFERLLAGTHTPTPQIAPQAAAQPIDPSKKLVKVDEIRGEIMVERELDYTINVCAQCGQSDCDCQPRRIIAVKQTIAYPVETVLATVVAWR